MKNINILYGIAILAVIGILVYCVSYTNGTARVDTPQQSAAYTAKSKQALKKKSCACCDKKKTRMHKMMRQWLNEKPQENLSNKEVSVTVADPERTQIVR
ncbi:hypothetical protein J4G08_12565 [Candidatus Poribacteria bacterium]|nr:hypothetical protein [Candidatus Poribacteria bacterium]